MKLEPSGAHSLDLAQHFLFMRQRDQQTPPLVVNVLAELVPVGRRTESDSLSQHVPQFVAAGGGRAAPEEGHAVAPQDERQVEELYGQTRPSSVEVVDPLLPVGRADPVLLSHRR